MNTIFQDWASAKPFIERALEYSKGTHTIDDVALLVGAGHFKVWIGKGCAMLTEVQLYPRMKILNVFAAGGDMKELLTLEESLIGAAKELGCERITEIGREGWLKVLPGAEKLGTALYRDIGKEPGP